MADKEQPGTDTVSAPTPPQATAAQPSCPCLASPGFHKGGSKDIGLPLQSSILVFMMLRGEFVFKQQDSCVSSLLSRQTNSEAEQTGKLCSPRSSSPLLAPNCFGSKSLWVLELEGPL